MSVPDVSTIDAALQWLLSHPDTGITLVVVLLGGGEALRQYRRTGRFPFQDLPWRAIRRLVYTVRRRVGRYPKPDAADLYSVGVNFETFRERVATQSYELEWPLSYHYKGEDLNARRYHYVPDRDYPHRQIHIRAWKTGDGQVQINAHEEPSVIQHPKAHMLSRDLTDCSRWVATNVRGTGNGLDPRAFERVREREARRTDPKSTGGFVFGQSGD